MIGKEIAFTDKAKKSAGQRMKQSINYVEADQKKHGGRVLDLHYRNAFDPETGDLELIALADANPRAELTQRHIVVSWPEGEIPTPEQGRQAAAILLKEMGLEKAVAKVVMHGDTDNVHLHVVVSTTNPETLKQFPVGWTLEEIHRAVAKIEHAQGWKPEQNARYVVMPDGQVLRSDETAKWKARAPAKADAKAATGEAHRGEKTALDVAQEWTGVFSDQKIRSWSDLHAALAPHGLSYQKAGSGAKIGVQIDGKTTFLKASDVSRDASFSKLEKRLGSFVESAVPIANRKPAPAADKPTTAAGQKRVSLWEQYSTAKAHFYSERKAAWERFQTYKKQANADLRAKQQAEYKEARAAGWKGTGGGLAVMQSILASEHAKQRADLRDRLTAERETFNVAFAGGFPRSFKEWADLQNVTLPSADKAVGNQYTTPGNRPGDELRPRPHDIRTYEAEVADSGRAVNYVNRENQSIDFIDYGKKIAVENTTDGSIRASLQLSVQKWGEISITGDDKFRQAAIEEAVRLGMADKITNEDLRDRVEAAKADHAERQEIAKREAEFQKMQEAIGADRYRVEARYERNGQPEGRLMGPLDGSPADSLPWQQIVREREKARATEFQFTPISDTRTHLTVADLDQRRLDQMQADGWKPAVVIQEGQGREARFTAILNYDKPSTDPQANKAAEDAFRHELRHYGEPKPGSGVPLPGREARVVETQGGSCPKAERFALGAAERHASGEAAVRDLHVRQMQAIAQTRTDRAYITHWQEVSRTETNLVRRDALIAERLRAGGHSGLADATYRKATGQDYDFREIQKTIEKMAPASRRESEQIPESERPTYAKRVAEQAHSRAASNRQADQEKQAGEYARYRAVEQRAEQAHQQHQEKGR